jgi:uncharacterized protein (DUF885 family)
MICRKMRRGIVLAFAFAWVGLPAQESNQDSPIDAIIAAHWEYRMQEFPLEATQSGIAEFNDRFRGVAPADQERRLAAEQSLLRRTRDIDPSRLSTSGRVNAELFEWVLEDSVRAYELNLARIPFNTFSGFYMDVLNASNGVPMNSVKDYEDYIARLRDVPRYFAENIDNMRAGIRGGFTLPKIVIEGVLPTIEAQLYDDPTMSSLYEPFQSMSSGLSSTEQGRLRQLAREAISEAALPAFASLATFLRDEYMDAATSTLGAEELPDGEAYYAHQIRSYTTLVDATSDEIHQVGLNEVTRIRAEMDAIIQELAFDGGFDEFADFLRTDPQFYATSAEQLLREATYIAKRIDYVMPEFFGKLPRLSYGVVPVPDEIAPNYTTGAYNPAPIGGNRGGTFWINTYALDQRPLYGLPSLTLHEAVPGHHHQSALAQELENVPAFRRNQYFSAFGEGWGLYSEKLGIEMGIYQTPYEHFGRLSYEMWRACRLVIDTGIHSQGWSRDDALDYLSDNTALSTANVRAEVDRYISWPGQALSYKLGELKIWELRHKAEQDLGEKFDIRYFHDALLGNGALPLKMLEAEIDRYIDATLE